MATNRPPAPLGYYWPGGARHVAARAPGALATSVRRAPRWAGSGPAHWHNGPVTVRKLRGPQHGPTNLATVRKRAMFGY